ncbi:MAG: hypothetical protein OXC44_00730 [Proteobacteria bacterium]|nr:hypothetical protein [Pseudomonadota bacterium]
MAIISVSCGSNHVASHHQADSKVSSVNDTSSHFVIADAKDDSSSLTFYSCSTSTQETEKLKNPAAHPNSCVNAFKTDTGQPFTVSKNQLKTKENLDHLSYNLEKLEQLNINDITISKAAVSRYNMTLLYTLLAGITAIARSKLSRGFLSKLSLITGLIAVGVAGIGFVVGPTSNRKHTQPSSNSSNTTGLESDRLNNLLKGSVDALNKVKHAFKEQTQSHGTFLKQFADMFKEFNLAKNKDIVEYCQMNPEKKCSPI